MPEKSQGPSMRSVPEGDTRERLVCPDCGFVQYDNPKIVVGAVATWDGKVLLCRRAADKSTFHQSYKAHHPCAIACFR